VKTVFRPQAGLAARQARVFRISASLAAAVVVMGIGTAAVPVRADVARDASLREAFRQGNGLYQAGRFDSALAVYEKVLDQGYENGPLYFNMGNCAYKLGRTGFAVLYYEKARRFMPSDEDLKANLLMANLRVVDKVEARSEFLPLRLFRIAVRSLPAAVWVLMTFCFLALGVAGYIVFLLTRNRLLALTGFRGAVLFGVLFIVAGLLWLGRVQSDRSLVEAVILAAKVDVMSAPGGQDSVESFSLHEGTKVRLDRESGEWVEIVLPDGKVGWVMKDALGRI
jgi:tetratricopeptide (TPR) repeat protein